MLKSGTGSFRFFFINLNSIPFCTDICRFSPERAEGQAIILSGPI